MTQTTSKQWRTRYPLKAMEPGDRFYFPGDRHKKIYRLSDSQPFTQEKQAGFWKRYAICFLADNPGLPIRHLESTIVIFLRNINNNPGQK